jgi:hypothetical protein
VIEDEPVNHAPTRQIHSGNSPVYQSRKGVFPMIARDEYVAKMKRQLDEWSAEMDTLEAQAHKTKEDNKVKYQEHLSALRAKRQEGEKRLEAIKSATEDSWEQLKAETENVWAAFKDSVHAFKAHFK